MDRFHHTIASNFGESAFECIPVPCDACMKSEIDGKKIIEMNWWTATTTTLTTIANRSFFQIENRDLHICPSIYSPVGMVTVLAQRPKARIAREWKTHSWARWDSTLRIVFELTDWLTIRTRHSASIKNSNSNSVSCLSARDLYMHV